jgi:hypothetical protein
LEELPRSTRPREKTQFIDRRTGEAAGDRGGPTLSMIAFRFLPIFEDDWDKLPIHFTFLRNSPAEGFPSATGTATMWLDRR